MEIFLKVLTSSKFFFFLVTCNETWEQRLQLLCTKGHPGKFSVTKCGPGCGGGDGAYYLVKKPSEPKKHKKTLCLLKAAILLWLLPEFGGVGGSSPTLHHLLDSFSFLLLPQSWLTGNWQQTSKCNWLMKIHCFALSHCLWQHGENMHLWVCIVICRTERLHWHLLHLWAGADYYPTYKDL